MILSIEDLRKKDFLLSKINIIHQVPKYRKLIVKKRVINGFLVILHGECSYFFKGGSFKLVPGSVVYLPLGSVHTLEVHSENIVFYRIDFQISVGEELVHFSDVPQKMCHIAPQECMEAVRELYDHCQFAQDSIRKTELICTILRTLSACSENARRERLAPAIRCLLENLTDRLDCVTLAQSCNLSSSQFYNLFREEYKMTPLEYRDAVLMKKAVMLLQDGILSVTEVAESLGFDYVSYFSRVFKKHYGMSPLKFMAHMKEEIENDSK